MSKDKDEGLEEGFIKIIDGVKYVRYADADQTARALVDRVKELEARITELQEDIMQRKALEIDANAKIAALTASLATQKDISAMDFDKINGLKAEVAEHEWISVEELKDKLHLVLTRLQAHKHVTNLCIAADLLGDAIEALPSASPTKTKLNPAILSLAETMQFKLDKNQHKDCEVMNPDRNGRGWSHCEPFWLSGRISDELYELEETLKCHLLEPEKFPAREVQLECADVANFAMMIHDNIARKQASPTKAESERSPFCKGSDCPEFLNQGCGKLCDSTKPKEQGSD